MHKYRIYFIGLLFLYSCTKQKILIDTIEITTNTKERLNKVKFFNSQIGFIVGGIQYSKPILLKTIDGGLTWTEVNLPIDNERKEIYGFDIYPDGKMITVGYGGTIFISNDTGNTFQYVQHGSWKELRDVAFINSGQSFIVGGISFNKGHLSEFKSDGIGSNQIREEKNFEISDIDFVGSNTIYYSGYGVIMKSVDDGNSWNFTPAKNDFFKAMTWKNVNEGIAVGYEGSIHKTTDGGNTWRVIRNGNDITKKKLHFMDVARNNESTIVAVGEKGIVYLSNDDGETWNETTKFFSDDLRGVTFRDNKTFYVVGDRGKAVEVALIY